jgi:hypothetical protein
MKRRVFLQLPLVAAPLAVAEANTRSAKRPKTGIKVDKDQDRFHEKIELGRVGSRIDTKVSSNDLESDLYIYESRTIGKGGLLCMYTRIRMNGFMCWKELMNFRSARSAIR